MRMRHVFPIGLLFLCLLALTCVVDVYGQDKPKVPLETLKWRRSTLMDKNEFTGEVDLGKATKVWVDKALTARGDAAVVPGLRAVVIGNLLVYRTYDDLRVLSLVDDKKPDGDKAGGIFWVGTPGDGGLVACLDRIPAGRETLTNWLSRYQQPDQAQVILENGLAGALSHDGQRIYWLDSLAVPRPVLLDKPDPGNPDMNPQELQSRLEHNVLWAVAVKSGKIEWRAGDVLAGKKDPFERSHFLGVPYSFQEKLYVLNETNQGEVRLAVLDPATGNLETTHPLETLQAQQLRFSAYARRQVHGAKMVADKGLMVCVPHTGKVFGVETPKHKVRWTYHYGGNFPGPGGPNQLGFWKHAEPFIREGKLVFTAADDDQVHCLNLEDGKFLWKTKAADGLYVAGIVGDKVLVVGNAGCRALSLKDGSEVWKVEVGTPSGIGVFDKGTYLLPLKKGSASKEPEIVYLDVERGQLVGTSPLTEMPGNLVLYQDQIVSVSATTVTAYRRPK